MLMRSIIFVINNKARFGAAGFFHVFYARIIHRYALFTFYLAVGNGDFGGKKIIRIARLLSLSQQNDM